MIKMEVLKKGENTNYLIFRSFLLHIVSKKQPVRTKMSRAVKMNKFALHARERRSEVSALLILGVWLRPRAVLDER